MKPDDVSPSAVSVDTNPERLDLKMVHEFLSGSYWARGIPLDCGCFGTALPSTVGPLTMLRDLAMGLPTFLMLAFPSRALSLDRRLFGAEDRFAVAATAVAAAARRIAPATPGAR